MVKKDCVSLHESGDETHVDYILVSWSALDQLAGYDEALCEAFTYTLQGFNSSIL